MTGRELHISLKLWERRHKYRQHKLDIAHAENNTKEIEHWHDRLEEAGAVIKRRRQQLEDLKPLRLRAYTTAAGLVGVMEQGGNNTGPMVSQIIRANGGLGPEAWCGDFAAYCYRLAGSRAVTRAWASVRLLGLAAGVSAILKPSTGDLVRYRFDHVGMFVKDNGDGTISTIEGNTGAVGATSDSTTGGDGVYRKVRSKSLVQDYLRITR